MYQFKFKNQKLKINLDLPKVLVIFSTILITFIIPIQLVNLFQNKNQTNISSELLTSDQLIEENAPNVAGISTLSETHYATAFGNIEKSKAPFIFFGVISIIITFLVLILFYLNPNQKDKNNF